MKEEKRIRKKIKMEDLLPRDPVHVDLDAIFNYVQGKAVLVTGGGGSIGSEICRQLAGHGVGHLIIFDIYENNAYQIQKSLEWEFPGLHMTVLIGSAPAVDVFPLLAGYCLSRSGAQACAPDGGQSE